MSERLSNHPEGDIGAPKYTRRIPGLTHDGGIGQPRIGPFHRCILPRLFSPDCRSTEGNTAGACGLTFDLDLDESVVLSSTSHIAHVAAVQFRV